MPRRGRQQSGPEPRGVQQQQQQQQQQAEAMPTINTFQMQRPQECGVCMFVYDEHEHRPRTLPCGHTFCFACVYVLLEDGSLTCPSCRTVHLASSPGDFPVNYTVEAMIKELQILGGASASPEEASAPRNSQAGEARRKKAAAAGLSRKLRSMIQEQKRNMRDLERALQQELEQLIQYRAQLALSRTDHVRLQEELEKLAQQHQAAIELLQEEDVRVEAFVEEGMEFREEMRTAQGQLEQVGTYQDAFRTIDSADHTSLGVEEWLQHSREEIPSCTTLSTSFKVVEMTTAALKVVTEEAKTTPEEATEKTPPDEATDQTTPDEATRDETTLDEATHDQVTSGHLDCTVMEAVQKFRGRPLKLADLCSTGLRKTVAAGKVFAVQHYKDRNCSSSKVTCEGYKVLLHSVEKGLPPPHCNTLEVNAALEDLDYRSICVFLDLSWLGMLSLRLHIQLKADTLLTRQFVVLCLGHSGLTYKGTKFLHLENSKYGRMVWGGDISGQRAAENDALPPLEADECGDAVVPEKGMVMASTNLSNDELHTKFSIIIGGRNSSLNYNYEKHYCLGHIEPAELNVLEEIVNNSGIVGMSVEDCGVVLSQ